MRIIIYQSLLYVLLSACTIFAQVQNKEKCAVLSFSTDDESNIGYGAMLANEITSQLSVSAKITAISRAYVNKISADLKIPISTIIQSASAKAKIYETMGCDVIVAGSIAGEKENIRVSAYIFSKRGAKRGIRFKVSGNLQKGMSLAASTITQDFFGIASDIPVPTSSTIVAGRRQIAIPENAFSDNKDMNQWKAERERVFAKQNRFLTDKKTLSEKNANEKTQRQVDSTSIEIKTHNEPTTTDPKQQHIVIDTNLSEEIVESDQPQPPPDLKPEETDEMVIPTPPSITPEEMENTVEPVSPKPFPLPPEASQPPPEKPVQPEIDGSTIETETVMPEPSPKVDAAVDIKEAPAVPEEKETDNKNESAEPVIKKKPAIKKEPKPLKPVVEKKKEIKKEPEPLKAAIKKEKSEQIKKEIVKEENYSGRFIAGLKYQYVSLIKSHDTSFIGSITDLEVASSDLPFSPVIDWQIDERWSLDFSWNQLNVRMISGADMTSDGTITMNGPDASLLYYFEAINNFKPYAGLGLSYMAGGFDKQAWWQYGYSSPSAWEAAGRPNTSANGKIRNMDIANSAGFIITGGIDCDLENHWTLSGYLRYTMLDAKDRYKIHIADYVEDRNTYTIPLDNFSIGLGMKHTF